MSNYPNMSYCMNENTLRALQQIVDAMDEEGRDFLRDLSREERRSFQELFELCGQFRNLAEELEYELDNEEDFEEESSTQV